MTPTWPNLYGDQRNFIGTLKSQLTQIESKVRVATVISSDEPSEAELNEAWSVQAGYDGEVPAGGRVQWFRPDRNALMSHYTRVGSEGLTLDGQLVEGVARPGTPTTECIYYNFMKADAASVAISAISQSYTDLLIHLRMRGVVAAAEATLLMTLNGDSSANYHQSVLRMQSSSLAGVEGIGQTSFQFLIPGGNSGRNQYSDLFLIIPRYSRAGRKRSIWGTWGEFRGSSIAATDMFWRTIHGAYNVVGPITSITLAASSGNLAKGSLATLIGY